MLKKKISILLIKLQLGRGDEGLFYCVDFCFVSVIPVDPNLITGDIRQHEGWVISDMLAEILIDWHNVLSAQWSTGEGPA